MRTDLLAYLANRGRSRGGRWRCPGHEGKGYNFAVWRIESERKWGVKCWSRGCSLELIMGGLGLPTSAIYDDAGEDQSTEAMSARYPGVVNMAAFRSKAEPGSFAERFRAEWGHNHCAGRTGAVLDVEADTGVIRGLPCRRLSCLACGPRIEWARWQFAIERYGGQAYVAELEDGKRWQGDYTRQPIAGRRVIIVSDEPQGDEPLGPIPAWAFQNTAHDGRTFSAGAAFTEAWKLEAAPLSLCSHNNSTRAKRDSHAEPWVLINRGVDAVWQLLEQNPAVEVDRSSDGRVAVLPEGAHTELLALGFRPADELAVMRPLSKAKRRELMLAHTGWPADWIAPEVAPF